MNDHAINDNPYAPPSTAMSKTRATDGGRRSGTVALRLLGASFGLFVLTSLAMGVLRSTKLGRVGFMIATVLALVGLVLGAASVVQSWRSVARLGTGFRVAVVLGGVLGNGLMGLVGAVAALMSTVTFSRGRQLRSLGRVLLARVRSSGDWAHLPLRVSVDESARAGLAAQWRENGRTEHASVAAFARLTLDLMALGAPPALVSAANRDALDEIRHTELCFSLARALDGKSESPGPFPEARRARTLSVGRTLALAELAVDSLVDGALHEGVSARVIARLARRCDEPQIRAMLKEIAADEGRHAAHGWDVVEWCLAEGGSSVARALAGALPALPSTLRTPLPEAAEDGGWEAFGIVGRALEADAFARTRADLVQRVEAMTRVEVRAAAA
jgi:hypothetical protein